MRFYDSEINIEYDGDGTGAERLKQGSFISNVDLS